MEITGEFSGRKFKIGINENDRSKCECCYLVKGSWCVIFQKATFADLLPWEIFESGLRRCRECIDVFDNGQDCPHDGDGRFE
jgi:hypothetical protein